MSENEPRTKIWVSREKTIQINQYEPLKVSAGIQVGMEIFASGEEMRSVLERLTEIVSASVEAQILDEQLKHDKSSLQPQGAPANLPRQVNPPPPAATPNKSSEEVRKEGAEAKTTAIVGGTCPKCKKGTVMKSKYGIGVYCSRYRDGCTWRD